jgi:hypothetical protein
VLALVPHPVVQWLCTHLGIAARAAQLFSLKEALARVAEPIPVSVGNLKVGMAYPQLFEGAYAFAEVHNLSSIRHDWQNLIWISLPAITRLLKMTLSEPQFRHCS